MIKGISVKILKKTEVGTDEFNRPIFEYEENGGAIVRNVLVAPVSTDDLVSSVDLTGKKVVYTLAIPKGDKNNWNDCVVRFWGKNWKTFGFPIEGIEENIPLDWNKKVMVELYE